MSFQPSFVVGNDALPDQSSKVLLGSLVVPPIARETRSLRVAIIEPNPDSIYQMAPSASVDLINILGAGNLDRIQLAIMTDNGGGTGSATMYDTRIQIFVNGSVLANKVLDCDLGTFFLHHGNNDGSIATWANDNMGVTHGASTAAGGSVYGDFGAFRRINVPYSTQIIVRIVNASSAAQGRIYSQVDYFPGVAPVGLYPASRNVFHSYFTPFTPVNQFFQVALLPTIFGSGCLDSIQMVIFGVSGVPSWLEGDPIVNFDGVSYSAGGTEDFFGGQYYWNQLLNRTNENGPGKIGAIAGSNFLTSMYRFFQRSPIYFNTSLGYLWFNGNPGQGGGNPPTVNVSCLVIYYTTT